MATELDITSKTNRIPMGPYFMQKFRVPCSAAATDEYIVTGFGNIVAIIGSVITGDTEEIDTNCFLQNNRGTDSAELTEAGSLGIQCGDALSIEVTILGD